MKLSRRRVIVGSVAVTALTVLSGCASTPSPQNQGNHASWVDSWDTYDDVLEDTSLVIIGEAIGQRKISSTEDGKGATDTTLTTFRVLQSYGADTDEVYVRSSDGFADDEVAVYQVGQEYLVYLTPFEFQPGKSTGTYITVGQLAAYQISGKEALRTTSRDGLPRQVTVDELVSKATTKFR